MNRLALWRFCLLTGVLLLFNSLCFAQDRGVDLLGTAVSPPNLEVGSTVEVVFTLYNRGQLAMRSMGPNSGYLYRQNTNYSSIDEKGAPGAFRVALDINKQFGIPFPYRWGIKEPIQPGQTGVVTGKVQFTQPGTYVLVPALEYSGRIIKSGFEPLTVHVYAKGALPKQTTPVITEPEEPVAEEAPAPITQIEPEYTGPPLQTLTEPVQPETTYPYGVGWRHVQIIYGVNTYDVYIPGPFNPFAPTQEIIPVPLHGQIVFPNTLFPQLLQLAMNTEAQNTLLIVTP